MSNNDYPWLQLNKNLKYNTNTSIRLITSQLYKTKSMTPSLGLFLLISTFALSWLSTLIFSQPNNEVLAQPYVETVKNRNLTFDLGNGLETNAQLFIPAVGSGPFPGVIIFPGAGAASVLSSTSPYPHMAKYLSERGFTVLIYDKRGVGSNFTISDSNAWGNLTFNNLKQTLRRLYQYYCSNLK